MAFLCQKMQFKKNLYPIMISHDATNLLEILNLGVLINGAEFGVCISSSSKSLALNGSVLGEHRVPLFQTLAWFT